MTGIIEEIQRGALDPAMPVDALLRRVKLSAVKLRLPELERWVENELSGYGDDELPDYRKLHGALYGWNPYHGWVPVQIDSGEMADIFTQAPIKQSIASLVDLLHRGNDADGEGLRFPLSARHVSILNDYVSYDCPQYSISLARSHLVTIVDRVRNLILDWAIRMEQEGIVGEGISFSEAEKQNARGAMTTINNYGNMAGHIGDGNQGAIRAEQAVNEASVFDKLAEAVSAGVTAGEDRARLLAAIKDMERARDDRNAFGVAYAAFISRAADYMSLVSPFLPALAQILSP